MPDACNSCKKSPPEVTLRRCAKCSSTPYCSRDCQKADWKLHKRACGRGHSSSSGSSSIRYDTQGPSSASAGTGELSPPKGLRGPGSKPFTRLDTDRWLHDRPEDDVYRLLVDAYRLRCDDDAKYGGGAEHSLVDFRRFLARVEGTRGGRLLPVWWAPEKRKACEALGMDRAQRQSLYLAVEKSDITEHYGDDQFPMQLRMFVEAVVGSAPGGMDGTAMRKMLVQVESGSLGHVNLTHASMG